MIARYDEVQVSESHRRSRLKRHHGLPPVTPNACIREGVMNLAFNNLWAEVGSILQPLIAAIRENYSQGTSHFLLMVIRMNLMLIPERLGVLIGQKS